MSLADNKRSVFNTIGAYTSLMEQGDAIRQTDLFPSINNKDDIVPFLLDVLKVVAGTEALKEAIGGIFTKLIDDVEPKMKEALKKQFVQSNADDPLPSTFVTNGITVPVKTIDVNGIFKNDPSSETGNLIYGSVSNFNTKAHDAILNASTPITFSNLSIEYLQTSDEFQIKPSGSIPNVGQYFSDYIDDVELIDKKLIISGVMDEIYGTLTKIQNKTVEQAHEELEVETLLRQVLNDDDSFIILPQKYDEILAKARESVEGVLNYDMGCGLMPAELSMDDFSRFVSTISGSTDPFIVGNQFEDTINQSTSGSTETQELTDENKQTIKDGFFQKIIDIFTVKLLGAVTTAPQIRVMFGMMSSLQNEGDVLLDKATNDMENFKTCIKCMAKEIMKLVGEFIFALAIGYLIKLLKPVIKKVIKEKIVQHSEIIVSLITALDRIKGVLT